MNELVAIIAVSIIIFGVVYLSGKDDFTEGYRDAKESYLSGKSLDKSTGSTEYLEGWEAFKSEI